VNGTTGYDAFQSTGGGHFVPAKTVVDTSATTATVANLASGTAYAIEVGALEAAGTFGHLSGAHCGHHAAVSIHSSVRCVQLQVIRRSPKGLQAGTSA
jgi:hypothetical protein